MRKICFVVIALVVFGVACSSGEGPPTVEQSSEPSSSAPASPAASHEQTVKNFTTETFTLELEADNEGSDFYFEPNFIKAPGGSTVTVEFRNEGDVEHNFSMDSPKADHDVEAGKTETFELKLGAETRYEFYCKYHKSSGMTGAFELH